MRMLFAVALFTMTLSMGAQAAPAPKSVQTITPLFHQLVAYSLPTTFILNAPDQQNQNFYIRETVLRGQTVERWTQMITLTGKRGAASAENAQSALNRAAAGFKQACPQSFNFKDLGSMNVAGAPAYGGVISCGHVEDEHGVPGAFHSETALYLAITGDQDFYTLQWAERGQASAKPIAFDGTKWTARLRTLNPIRICPVLPGEKAPYPSCVGN